MVRGIALALGLWGSGAGAAAPAPALEVAVVDDRGAPVADAVVTVQSNAGLDTGPGAPETKAIDQHALTFDPYLELFRPGDRVVFHNSDRTSHHVYSFSPVKPFETMVAPGASTEPMVLDRPGVVAVGCNIHDRMVTYLFVSDAPFVARTGADGLVRFDDVPAGAWTVRVWQPRLKPTQKSPTEASVSRAAGSPPTRLRFELALLPDGRRRRDRESADY